ncbi:hypothetical protein [Haloarcula salina]|uniref:Uncharacterized protein n=1 Tax=Haloarcula salina TaxID=1429914 RepID=A0AA41KHV6_9EURY|nr:hypothetical protein [Haloarcula salina]MBV0900998.1 hypothetical protein [Haloarcula salina]
MTERTTLSARTRLAEAETHLRRAREELDGGDDALIALVDETLRDVTTLRAVLESQGTDAKWLDDTHALTQ